MQKFFCDKCEKEMDYDNVKVEYKNGESSIGKDYVYRQLCPNCKKEFIKLLNDFLPNFMNNLPIEKKPEIKKRTFFGKISKKMRIIND